MTQNKYVRENNNILTSNFLRHSMDTFEITYEITYHFICCYIILDIALALMMNICIFLVLKSLLAKTLRTCFIDL